MFIASFGSIVKKLALIQMSVKAPLSMHQLLVAKWGVPVQGFCADCFGCYHTIYELKQWIKHKRWNSLCHDTPATNIVIIKAVDAATKTIKHNNLYMSCYWTPKTIHTYCLKTSQNSIETYNYKNHHEAPMGMVSWLALSHESRYASFLSKVSVDALVEAEGSCAFQADMSSGSP